DAEVQGTRITLGVPRKICSRSDVRDQVELVNAIAVKVDRGYSDPTKLVEACGVKMGIIKVAKKEMHWRDPMRGSNLIENLLRHSRASFQLLWRKLRGHVH